jgi:hypothetical protein
MNDIWKLDVAFSSTNFDSDTEWHIKVPLRGEPLILRYPGVNGSELGTGYGHIYKPEIGHLKRALEQDDVIE